MIGAAIYVPLWYDYQLDTWLPKGDVFVDRSRVFGGIITADRYGVNIRDVQIYGQGRDQEGVV